MDLLQRCNLFFIAILEKELSDLFFASLSSVPFRQAGCIPIYVITHRHPATCKSQYFQMEKNTSCNLTFSSLFVCHQFSENEKKKRDDHSVGFVSINYLFSDSQPSDALMYAVVRHFSQKAGNSCKSLVKYLVSELATNNSIIKRLRNELVSAIFQRDSIEIKLGMGLPPELRPVRS